MTKADRKVLTDYVRSVADDLGLKDWAIEVSDEEPIDPDANASCQPTYGRKYATLRFASDFREHKPESQRNTVVHELLHCHLHPLGEQAEWDLSELIGKSADFAFCKAFRRNLEYAVDGLAGAYSKHQPLIEWPKTS